MLETRSTAGRLGGGCSYVVAPAAVAPMCHIVEGLRVRIEEGVDEPEGWLPCRAAQTVELCNDGREDWGRGRRAVRPRRVVTAELASIDAILILLATEGGHVGESAPRRIPPTVRGQHRLGRREVCLDSCRLVGRLRKVVGEATATARPRHLLPDYILGDEIGAADGCDPRGGRGEARVVGLAHGHVGGGARGRVEGGDGWVDRAGWGWVLVYAGGCGLVWRWSGEVVGDEIVASHCL